MTARAEQVAEQLEGTCKSLCDFATPEEQDDPAFCEALDDKVRQCVACGWWVEASDVDDEDRCSECQPE